MNNIQNLTRPFESIFFSDDELYDNIILRYSDRSSGQLKYEHIIESEGNLLVLEKIYDRRTGDEYYLQGKSSLFELVWKVTAEACSIPCVENLKKVLESKSFESDLPSFFQKVFMPDAAGKAPLFMLPKLVALEIVNMAFEKGYIHKGTVLEIIEQYIEEGFDKTEVQNLFAKINITPPYYQLWLDVVNDRPLNEEFYQKLSALSPRHQSLIYASAYGYNNPFLHEPATRPVRPDQCSINVMWINKSPQKADFINGDEEEFRKKIVQPVSQWVEKNPDVEMNIWIDSSMVSDEAIDRSREKLEELGPKVRMRDLRALETVWNNSGAFSERMPVYFRADLGRAVAGDAVVRNGEREFFVYFDLKTKPISLHQIFDEKTVRFLDEFGFVMQRGGCHGFENSFQILSGKQPFLDSHREVIIDQSIEMANERPEAIVEQQIYDTYPAMVAHFLDADGRYGKFVQSEQILLYSLNPFRCDNWKGKYDSYSLPFERGSVNLRKMMPTKPIDAPRSHFY